MIVVKRNNKATHTHRDGQCVPKNNILNIAYVYS